MRRPGWKTLRRTAIVLVLAALAAPHVIAAYQYRAAIRDLDRHHPESARRRLDSCLKTWPNLVSARLLASRASRQAGDFDDAARQLHEARRAEEGSSDDIAFEWALLQAAGGKVLEVQDYLQKQSAARPEEAPLVWESLAEGYLVTYRTLDAMRCLDHWLKGSPDDVKALELRGRTFILGKGVKRGTDDYRRVLELDPDREETRLRLCHALLDLGGYSEALPHLQRLAANRPDETDVPVLLARSLYMLDREAEAWRTIEAELAKHPDNGRALRTTGHFLLSEGKYSEAEQRLRAATAAMPDDYQSHFMLSAALANQKKPEAAAALKDAEAARDRSERLGELQSRRLADQPLDPGLHVEMAAILMRSGNASAAVSWLNNALALDPNFRPAHRMLAEHYSKSGDAARAAEHRKLAEE